MRFSEAAQEVQTHKAHEITKFAADGFVRGRRRLAAAGVDLAPPPPPKKPSLERIPQAPVPIDEIYSLPPFPSMEVCLPPFPSMEVCLPHFGCCLTGPAASLTSPFVCSWMLMTHPMVTCIMCESTFSTFTKSNRSRWKWSRGSVSSCPLSFCTCCLTAPTHCLADSLSHRPAVSPTRCLADSLSRRLAVSPTRRPADSPSHRLTVSLSIAEDSFRQLLLTVDKENARIHKENMRLSDILKDRDSHIDRLSRERENEARARHAAEKENRQLRQHVSQYESERKELETEVSNCSLPSTLRPLISVPLRSLCPYLPLSDILPPLLYFLSLLPPFLVLPPFLSLPPSPCL